MPTTAATMVAPAADLEPATTTERPHAGAIVKHLALSILMANVVPGILFYITMRLENVWTALIIALLWCYGSLAWRMSTKRRTSGLLIITMVGLTAKTLMAFASGSTFMYFAQPAITDGLIAALFLSSLTTARPVVARLAGDFFPMDEDIAKRPRIQKLFWNLTLFWAIICFVKAAFTFWLLENVSTNTFVAVKGLFILAVIITGATITVVTAVRVAHAEGLLHRTATA